MLRKIIFLSRHIERLQENTNILTIKIFLMNYKILLQFNVFPPFLVTLSIKDSTQQVQQHLTWLRLHFLKMFLQILYGNRLNSNYTYTKNTLI